MERQRLAPKRPTFGCRRMAAFARLVDVARRIVGLAMIATAIAGHGVTCVSAMGQPPAGYAKLANRDAPTANEDYLGSSPPRSLIRRQSWLDEPDSHTTMQTRADVGTAGIESVPPGLILDGSFNDWRYDTGATGPMRDRLWFRGEYLMWWNRDADLPALATTSPANTPRPQAGVLGAPTTSILFGDDDVTNGMHSGGRFTAGIWSDDCQEVGFEAVYLFLNRAESVFAADSQSTPILARPFFNVTSNQQDAVLVAYPGQSAGSITIRDGTRMWTGELLMRRALAREKTRDLDWLIGYRYARMDESLTADQSITITNPIGVIPVGTVFTAFDRFATRNDFHGAEIGAETRAYRGNWTVNLAAKVAFGDTRSRVDIAGNSVVAIPNNAPVGSAGGVLAQPTNIGQFHRNMFTMLPEFDARIDCHLTSNLSLTCGYTFLYWSRLARPQDQIDTNLNPTQFSGGQLTGTAAPIHRFTSVDFWAQGVSFGVDYQY